LKAGELKVRPGHEPAMGRSAELLPATVGGDPAGRGPGHTPGCGATRGSGRPVD